LGKTIEEKYLGTRSLPSTDFDAHLKGMSAYAANEASLQHAGNSYQYLQQSPAFDQMLRFVK